MRIYLSIAFVMGVLAVGVLSYPAGRAETPPTPGGATRYVGLGDAQMEQLERRIDQTVRELGVVETAETLEIRCEVEAEVATAILHIVPDRSVVKKGDLLVELDGSSLQRELLKQQVAVAEAQGALRQAETATAAAKEERQIQLAAAELALKVAELDRSRCLAEGGELELQLRSVERGIAVAEQRLKVAQIMFERIEKGGADKADSEQARLAVVEAQAALQTAQASKQLLAGHTRDYRTAALELAVLQAQSTLTQIKNRSEAALAKAEAEVRSSNAALQLEEARLAPIREQIDKCRIYAPRGGLVEYANVRLRGGGEIVIKEGAILRPEQTILRMPDMSRLRVRVRASESRINRICEGQPVGIRFDAFPDREFRGKVVEIGNTPEPASWLPSDVKEYPVLVSIENPTPDLKIGMTGVAEIDVSQPSRE